MNRFLFLITLLASVEAAAQVQGPPLEEDLQPPGFSVGVSGALSFVDPERLNDGIHFINTTLDLNVPRVNSLISGSGFLRIWLNPKGYVVLKGEYIGFSRSFEYSSPVTSTSSSGSSSFNVTNERRYKVIPLGIGVGYCPGQVRNLEVEAGFHYLLGSIKETGDLQGYGSYSTDYDGTGIGFWVLVRPHIRLSDAVSLAPDVTGRMLLVKNFEDQRGRVLKDFDLNFSSISLGLSLIVTFR